MQDEQPQQERKFAKIIANINSKIDRLESELSPILTEIPKPPIKACGQGSLLLADMDIIDFRLWELLNRINL